MYAKVLRFGALCMLSMGLFACDALNDIGPEICRRPIDDEPIEYDGGTTIAGTYTTSDWDGPLLYFVGGEYYRLNHDLGVVPPVVLPYVSFNEGGVSTDAEGGGDPGSLAPATGNQVEIKRVTASFIDVLNGSCVDYYLRVVATDGGLGTSSGSAMGGGGSGGSGAGGGG